MINSQHLIHGFNEKKASQPYLVIIQGVKSLSLQDTQFGKPANNQAAPSQVQGAVYYVEYHATLHSEQSNGLFGFYGRTCSSGPKRLKVSASNPNELETDEEAFFFFHTSFTERTSKLIIEMVIT